MGTAIAFLRPQLDGMEPREPGGSVTIGTGLTNLASPRRGILARTLRGAVLLFLFLASGALLHTAQATGETRSLRIYHVHTGERAVITFEKDGHYLPDGLKQLNYILRDWRRNESTRMDPHLFDLLWKAYQMCGSNDYIHVICGYRAPETNEMLRTRSRGVAKFSQHMLGKAIDFFIPGVSLTRLRQIGLKLGDGGVGFYPTSGSPFVHMDVGSPRYWPRMSREELLALFPDGKTMYVPADGKPLPGYEQAVAAYEARQGSSSQVQVASASSGSSTGRKRTLLGFLFGRSGGGADEADDVADSNATASPAAQPAPSALGEDARQVAALSDQFDDLPSVAPVLPSPRPSRAPDIPIQTVASALAPMMGPPAAEKIERAAYVPRPAVGVSQAARVEDLIASAQAQPGEGEPQASVAAARFAVPLPIMRPERGEDGRGSTAPAFRPGLVAALVPQPRPDRTAELIGAITAEQAVSDLQAPAGKAAGIASADGAAGGAVVRLASLTPGDSPRSALLAAGPQADPIAAIDAGVRTATKDARLDAADAFSAPLPEPVPVTSIPDRMLAGERLRNVSAALRAAGTGKAILIAPTVVYTAGFQKTPPPAPDRLSGRSVTFMSVARFAAL